MKRVLCLVVVSACAAKKPAVPDAGMKAPFARLEPLEPVRLRDDDAGVDQHFKVKPLSLVGPQVPQGLVEVKIDGENHTWGGAATRVLLVPAGDTYVAQASALLAKLDDAGAEVWLKHPDAAIAFAVQLRDEPAFRAWLDEPVAGKLRVIHRADGFELQTNLGKLPGPDVNGPTVPLRGGEMDLTTLQRGLEKISLRFKGAPDLCFVPSFGMALNDTVRAMAANYTDSSTSYFATTCLVYPRPREAAVDGGVEPAP